MYPHIKTFILISIFITLTSCTPAAEPSPTDNPEASDSAETAGDSTATTLPYDDQVIEIIVPYKEGGGTDAWARLIAPYFQSYLGDTTTVQVINQPGASGVQGANDFALVRESDGLSLLVSSGSNVLPFLLGEEAVKYDFNEFRGIIGSPQGAVVYVSAETGITSAEELCGASGLIFGGVSATGQDIVPLIAFDMLDLDFIPILGYEGRGPARVALEQGEINIDFQASSAYVKNVLPLIETGIATPIFTFGTLDENGDVVRDPQFSDLPSFAEVYESCAGEAPQGIQYEAYKAVLTAAFAAQKNIWVHGDAPQDRVDALVNAAQLTIEDADFQEQAQELLGPNPFDYGAEAQAKFSAAANINPETLEWLFDFLSNSYDVDFN